MISVIGRLRGVRLDVRAPRNKFQAKRCKRGAFAGSMPNANFLTNAAPEFASRDCSWLFGPGECVCPSRMGGGALGAMRDSTTGVKHDVRTRSYPVVREQKSNSNRIHSGRSNYMDFRHHTFAYARDRVRMLSWHASSERDSLMARLMACGWSHRQAASGVRSNRP